MQVPDNDRIMLKVKEIIANDLDTGIAIEDLRDESSLYEDGIGLDSINIVNLIVLIEQRFNVNFEPEEITAAMFSNIKSLAAHIEAKLSLEYR